MNYVKAPYRAATSSTAKRAYLGTFLFFATSLVLLCIAALAYPVFYYNYVPEKVVSIPVHLQYNAGLNPYGVTSLSKNLIREQAYDVTVELTLPRSPANLERGNFMVALFAMKSLPDNPAFSFSVPADPYEHVMADNVVFSSRRPVLIPYTDPLVSTASRAMFLLYHIFFPVSQKSILTIPMGELVEFNDALPLSVLLDIQAGQTLQVYSSTITLVARLTGIRWLMYNHRILSFLVCTTVFWLAEMMSMGVAWMILGYLFMGPSQAGRPLNRGDVGGNRLAGVKRRDSAHRIQYDDDEEEEDDDGESVSQEVKHDIDPAVKQEDDDIDIKAESTEQETLVNVPRHPGGDTDDEEDAEDPWKEESGTGTSFDGSKGTSLRRRSSRGGRS
ncbi:hypothetical protein F5Y15DRAFT_371936 [Xylariaceae sp. FL0016]|nr:hypothetical protein F5Y15DRAFT_371936 [Xylariaceae sp. FL0016]